MTVNSGVLGVFIQLGLSLNLPLVTTPTGNSLCPIPPSAHLLRSLFCPNGGDPGLSFHPQESPWALSRCLVV